LAASATSPGSNWDASMLTTLERALASFVGPLAKMLVKQAAAKSVDYNTLVGAVAQHLQSDDERAQFMAKIIKTGTMGSVVQRTGPGSSGVSQAGTSPSMGTAGTAGTGGSAAQQALTPGFVAHATRVLASHMGPLAKVIVKKAEAQAGNAQQFIDLLVQHCADGVDRDRLQQELKKGVGPQTGA